MILYCLGGMIFLFDEDKHKIGYLKQITIVGFVYTFGVVLNYIYFVNGPLPDLLGHFPFGWVTILGLAGIALGAAITFVIWRWTFNRREARAQLVGEAEARGELVI